MEWAERMGLFEGCISRDGSVQVMIPDILLSCSICLRTGTLELLFICLRIDSLLRDNHCRDLNMPSFFDVI